MLALMINASASISDFGPFQSEIWGTVSDWVMIFVTMVTAYYLYRTLQSQKIVQEAQSQITIIENERYRNEHLPVFDLKCTQTDVERLEKEVRLIPVFILKLSGGACKYVKLKHHLPKDSSVKWPLHFSFSYNNYKNGRTISFRLPITIDHEKFPRDTIVSFSVECADYVNNKYQQTFKYKYSSFGGWNVENGDTQYLQ